MNPLPAILVLAFFVWLFHDFYKTKVTPDAPEREDDLDITERFYHDKYDQN